MLRRRTSKPPVTEAPSALVTEPEITTRVEYEPHLGPAPTEIIPDFLRYAAAELPWRVGSIQGQDIGIALRAAREHYVRTYPNGESLDWAALADNCRHRILFVVLDELDFSCPSLGHLSSVRKTTREELISYFETAATSFEDRVDRKVTPLRALDDAVPTTAS